MRGPFSPAPRGDMRSRRPPLSGCIVQHIAGILTGQAQTFFLWRFQKLFFQCCRNRESGTHGAASRSTKSSKQKIRIVHGKPPATILNRELVIGGCTVLGSVILMTVPSPLSSAVLQKRVADAHAHATREGWPRPGALEAIRLTLAGTPLPAS